MAGITRASTIQVLKRHNSVIETSTQSSYKASMRHTRVDTRAGRTRVTPEQGTHYVWYVNRGNELLRRQSPEDRLHCPV